MNTVILSLKISSGHPQPVREFLKLKAGQKMKIVQRLKRPGSLNRSPWRSIREMRGAFQGHEHATLKGARPPVKLVDSSGWIDISRRRPELRQFFAKAVERQDDLVVPTFPC